MKDLNSYLRFLSTIDTLLIKNRIDLFFLYLTNCTKVYMASWVW